MNCEQMTLLLSAWLDGEVTAQEEKQMQAHLEQCPECRALLEQLQALHTSFSDLEEIPAPDGFAQGVMARIEVETKPKVVPLFKRPQFRAMAGLAACVALFIGFSSVLPWGGSSEPAAQAPESAPAAAAYDMAGDAAMPQTESAAGSYALAPDSAPAESAPEMEMDTGTTQTTAAEPTAPAPEPTEAPEVRTDVDATSGSGETMEALRKEAALILLAELPEGAEDVLGPLYWEERIEDGALCAQLTREQAEKLLELADAQGLAVEQTVSADGGTTAWTLVLQPN